MAESRYLNSPRYVPIHDRWLSGVAVIFGYLWLVSGLSKILSATFVSGFAGFVKDQYLGPDAYAWYRNFLESMVVPQAPLMAQAVQWGELLLGLALITAGIWLFIKDSRAAHAVIAWASIGSSLLVFNILMTEGSALPAINTKDVFQEGVGLDTIVLLTSALLAAANFRESSRETRRSKN